MTENTPPQGQGQRRRRRRRRGSGHAQNNAQNKQSPDKQGSGKQGSGKQGAEKQGSDKQNPNKNRKRNNQRNNQRGSKRGNQRGGKQSGKNYYRRPNSSTSGAKRTYTPVHNMETRDETSAGGLVVSGMAEAVCKDGSVNLARIYVALIGRIDRRGRLLWSMPKGHVEPGEDKWATSRREVWEETGIVGEPFEELGVIDYWFVSDGVRIHKTVHHNLLRYVDGVLNNDDPEVTEVAWVPISELIEYLAYADERKLARIAIDRMPDLARAERDAGRVTPR